MTASAAAHSDPYGGSRSARDRSVLRLLGAEAAAELAGRVATGRELARRSAERRRDAFSTGLAPLDRLLDGGLVRGALVELVGRPGSGRFAAVLATLAAATGGAGEAAALVDLGDHLDPQAAAAAGIDAARLLWLRPRRVQEALAAAEAALQGGFPLVVVDLGTPPVPGGRGNEAGWVRLARAAQAQGAALLVASPYRVSGTAAQTVVEARPGRAVYASGEPGSPTLLVGRETAWVLEKSRGRQGGEEERAELVVTGAVLPEGEANRSAKGRAAGETGEAAPAWGAAEAAAGSTKGTAAGGEDGAVPARGAAADEAAPFAEPFAAPAARAPRSAEPAAVAGRRGPRRRRGGRRLGGLQVVPPSAGGSFDAASA